MPITKIRLKNFKCFADSGEIDIAPLTVIFGRNNSGKSSILQSLLLLRQTIDSPEYGPRVNLRGPLYPAGSFADIIHQHRSKQRLMLCFGLEGAKGEALGEIEMEFQSDEPRAPVLSRLAIRSRAAQTLEIGRGRGAGGPYSLHIGGRNLGLEKSANFRFPVNQFLPLIGGEPRRRGRPSPERERSRAVASEMLLALEGILHGLRAMGAFRRQPERRYEFQGRLPEVVDAVGEHVVNALIDDATRRRGRGELLKSVNRRLKLVGQVRLLPLRRISKAARIFEIRLKDLDSGRWANFADVGFGIGQAFPVLVEGLRTPPGGLFLVQEPEIHLHPDAQLAMADFLVDLVRSGRRVIAETHSEHLLLRLRRLMIGGARDGRFTRPLKPEQVSLIHVSKAPDGTSTTQRLELDELAQIKNWPVGFMEEATEERLAIMKAIGEQAEAD